MFFRHNLIKMRSIHIWNNRNPGSLYHYTHFICDCLFTEVVNELYQYDIVYREKSLDQTLGNFGKIYSDVMQVEHIELSPHEFHVFPIVVNEKKEHYANREFFDKFRNYIFQRYNVSSDLKKFPEVILICRGDRIELIDDEELQKINTNITMGKERREIYGIDQIDIFLQHKYKNKYQSLFLENMPFEEQVHYFYNCKLLVCAHGAAMANMFFCKENTKIVEVQCGKSWDFFDTISDILHLIHYKCVPNHPSEVINILNTITI